MLTVSEVSTENVLVRAVIGAVGVLTVSEVSTENVLVGAVVGAVGVLTVNEVSTENALMSLIELMAATDATYSALGIKSCRITLVSLVYTIV